MYVQYMNVKKPSDMAEKISCCICIRVSTSDKMDLTVCQKDLEGGEECWGVEWSLKLILVNDYCASRDIIFSYTSF